MKCHIVKLYGIQASKRPQAGSGEGSVMRVREEEMRRRKRIEHGGDVYVMCDVERDEAVQATGNVAVWGIIKGRVHAGWPTSDAKIDAIGLDPSAVVMIGNETLKNAEDTRMQLHQSGFPCNRAMIKAALVTGSYATLLGSAIMLFPLTVYGLLFDVNLVATGLIRLGGAFLVVIGIQYLGTAMGDIKSAESFLGRRIRNFSGFYHSTIISRMFLIAVVVVLVLSKSLELSWLVFAALNGIGAFSMVQAVRYKLHNSHSK